MHSILLIVNRYICNIDEHLSERHHREVIWDQSPSIVALLSINKPVVFGDVCFMPDSNYRMTPISFMVHFSVRPHFL